MAVSRHPLLQRSPFTAANVLIPFFSIGPLLSGLKIKPTWLQGDVPGQGHAVRVDGAAAQRAGAAVVCARRKHLQGAIAVHSSVNKTNFK